MHAASDLGSLVDLLQLASAALPASDSSKLSMKSVSFWVRTSCGGRLGFGSSFFAGAVSVFASGDGVWAAAPPSGADAASAALADPAGGAFSLPAAGGALAEPPPQAAMAIAAAQQPII